MILVFFRPAFDRAFFGWLVGSARVVGNSRVGRSVATDSTLSHDARGVREGPIGMCVFAALGSQTENKKMIEASPTSIS